MIMIELFRWRRCSAAVSGRGGFAVHDGIEPALLRFVRLFAKVACCSPQPISVDASTKSPDFGRLNRRGGA